ncbi:Receptor-like kinase [Melia azedarach]|uniref:Receptor-like kinase n=1 Tax=Melia azedarach TaxID=155640 RepID=A0ACC1XPN9_MELAZ|nr:Receptor-like kinase [Melia azedarach]
MNSHFFPLLIFHSVITILCILIAIPSSYCKDDEQYLACNRRSSCGPHFLDIPYPFWGNNIRPQYCGRQEFELKCQDNQHTAIQFGDQSFRVLDINGLNQIMTIARADLLVSICPMIFQKTIINHTLFSYSRNVGNISVYYDCSGELSSLGQNNFSCYLQRGEITGFYTIDNDSRLRNRTNSCKRVIKVPVLLTDVGDVLAGRLSEALNQGFEVEYRTDNASCSACLSSFGICGSNRYSDQFACLCLDKPRSRICPSGNSPNTSPKINGGASEACGIIGIVTMASVFFCLVRSKISSNPSMSSFGKMRNSCQDLEAFIRDCGPLALKRFNFSDVTMITNSFEVKLGEGGYGCVYKGKLSDGRLVAVKLLNISKWNGQDFINEVVSISRTSHINVVTLLGYCLEGSKRALIYEFMPNGSLEKFIYNGDTTKPTQQLRWEKMYEIVVGIARGLEYLHRGCNTRILHFDIKPHNILLDEDFCPKISDFGLAKLCPKNKSIVSILDARGTIGYIAPEVFNRYFGNVSHKSDVYSYGMMVLEIVGCRKNLDVRGHNSSELYFPQWVYRQVAQGQEFEWPGVVTIEENEIAKKMIIVGLCHLCPSLALHSILTILCVLIAVPSSYCDEDEQYTTCNRSYSCGQIDHDVWYPFWGNNRPQFCGLRGFELRCDDNQYTSIQIGDQTFRVLFIHVVLQKVIIARNDLSGSLCSAGIFQDFREIIIDHNLFNYSPNVRNLSLYYNCSDELSREGKNDISCPPEKITGFYTIDGNSLLPNRSKSCNRVIKVPFLQTDEPPLNTTRDLLAGKWNDVLIRGFEVEYRTYNEACSRCVSSAGICGSNQSNLEQFACLCRDKPHMNTCANPGMAKLSPLWQSLVMDLYDQLIMMLVKLKEAFIPSYL